MRALKDDDSFVAARLARQQRLDADPPLSVEVMLYEAALRHLVGDRGVMRSQLEHLTATVERSRVTLRVLPFGVGAMLGLDCTLDVLSFAEPGAMDIVYLDGLFCGRWAEGGKEAVQHVTLFERIAERAPSPQDSLSLINDIRDEL